MGLHCLIVEPNIVARGFCVRALQRSGIEIATIREAGHGREALDLLRAQRADLVITALAMPELDGIGLCAALRGDAQLADIPVVLLTSERTARVRAMTEQYGARGCLLRPFRPEAVRVLVSEVLGKSGAPA